MPPDTPIQAPSKLHQALRLAANLAARAAIGLSLILIGWATFSPTSPPRPVFLAVFFAILSAVIILAVEMIVFERWYLRERRQRQERMRQALQRINADQTKASQHEGDAPK